jgi:hypothetical protein
MPREDDPGVFLVAEGLERFGVRFMDETGEWTDRWDSSTLARSSQLPLVAEVTVQMAPLQPGDEPDEPYVRRVLLPMRPFDLEAQLSGNLGPGGGDEKDEDGDQEGEGEDANCLRVRDCVDASLIGPELLGIILELQDQCIDDVGVPSDAILPSCRGGGRGL